MSASSVYMREAGRLPLQVAKEHEFSRWQEIYNHPSNRHPRKYPNLNRIFAGDVIIFQA